MHRQGNNAKLNSRITDADGANTAMEGLHVFTTGTGKQHVKCRDTNNHRDKQHGWSGEASNMLHRDSDSSCAWPAKFT